MIRNGHSIRSGLGVLMLSAACLAWPSPGWTSDPLVRQVAPSTTDSALSGGTGSHLVALADDRATGYLVLFYPGTGAAPDAYSTLLAWVAARGHHVIGLSYRNSGSVNFTWCRGELGTGCHADVRTEILTGADTSPRIAVDEPNSAFGRLRRLLDWLAAAYPEERWETFLDDGDIAWERVIVAGQSQGGGHAAFTAKLHRVPRAVLFSATEPAPWTSDPGATPAEAYFAVAHELERNYAGITRSWSLLGLPGALMNIDDAAPPWGGSHRLVTARTDCSGDPDSNGFSHNCTSADDWLPAPTPEGIPAFAALWDRLFVMHPGGPRGRISVAGPMGQAGANYIDPEVLPGEGLLTWQDDTGAILLGGVAMADARFRVSGGVEHRLDSGAWPVGETFNGPEFGVDADGWSVFYTKANGGLPALWRAGLEKGVAVAAPLTAGFRRQTVLASKDPAAVQTRLLFLRGDRDSGEVTWQDEDAPASETPLGFNDLGVRWIDGQRRFVRTAETGPAAGELVLVDTVTGASRQLTTDGGAKRFPYGFVDPLSGQLRVLALIDGDTRIGLWEDPGDGGLFTPVRTLAVPGGGGRSLGSPEPFVADGRSWVSFVVRDGVAGGPAEVWLASTDGHAAWRCDDGEPELARSDPETLVRDGQVSVFYNVIAPEGYRLYRCVSELPDTGLVFRGGFEG